jgi:hypothetical protein
LVRSAEVSGLRGRIFWPIEDLESAHCSLGSESLYILATTVYSGHNNETSKRASLFAISRRGCTTFLAVRICKKAAANEVWTDATKKSRFITN